jgi:adenylate cyclase
MRAKSLSWSYRTLFGLALTGVVCAGLAGVWSIPFVESLDRQAYDARLRLLRADPVAQVVVVDIDERALAEVGRWPWSRSTMAQMARALHQQGKARTIAFDILFAESQSQAGEDSALAEAIAEAPVVLGYYLSNDRDGRTSGRLPAPTFSAKALQDLKIPVHSWTGYGANLPELQTRAQGAGFFTPILDDDGVVRRVPLVGKLAGDYYESFSVAVLRHYLGRASISLDNEALELVGTAGRVRLPLSLGSSALVPFAGATLRAPDLPFSGRFTVISAADVISGTLDWRQLNDRIVLIGTSAPGLSDLRATPISRATAGVEIHATLIAGALQAASSDAAPQLKQWPQDAALLGLLVCAASGVLLSVLMPLTGVFGVLSLGALASLALLVWTAVAFGSLNYVVPVSTAVALTLLLTGANLALGYIIEGRARRAVADLFGEYVSPEVVERMTRDPTRFGTMISENRELTILFADIRGFTRISESMEPAQLREFINEFLTAMTECIYQHQGTVDKYIGDAVMAFWGAPMPDEQHADNAVAAAMAMIAEVAKLNKLGSQKGWPTLSIGIGINTGVARVGDMGSKLRRAYTVLGDAVNLASRLEALTKQFNTPIIVGEATARQVRRQSFSELAQVTVAGRSESTRIFIPTMLSVKRPVMPLSDPAQAMPHEIDARAPRTLDA